MKKQEILKRLMTVYELTYNSYIDEMNIINTKNKSELGFEEGRAHAFKCTLLRLENLIISEIKIQKGKQ